VLLYFLPHLSRAVSVTWTLGIRYAWEREKNSVEHWRLPYMCCGELGEVGACCRAHIPNSLHREQGSKGRRKLQRMSYVVIIH
jgi:hypothetical protein